MGKLVFAVVAAFASLILAESLTCNKCSFNLFGACVIPTSEICAVNNSVCYTGRAKFPALPNFLGFSSQGCRNNNSDCDTTTSSTLLGATYNTSISCCSADKCNPTTLSAAPSTRMTFTTAVGGAILASMFGSIM